MARFFIEHPVFAMVIAIVIVILGAVAIPSLPVASYPEVVPPVVQITTSYLGGNSLDLEKTVSQPIEEQLIGLDGMLFFLSSRRHDGSANIQVSFPLWKKPCRSPTKSSGSASTACSFFSLAAATMARSIFRSPSASAPPPTRPRCR